MNFTEKNESGIPLWYLVWKGEKTVTRRRHAVPFGWKSIKHGVKHSIAICPGRGKSAICKNCGGWKEWHVESWQSDFIFQVLNHGKTITFKPCHNYVPLRKKIVGCKLESEWAIRIQREMSEEANNPDATDEQQMDYFSALSERTRLDEARCEAFATWEGLQAALKRTNPKGEPLYRIEMEGDHGKTTQ